MSEYSGFFNAETDGNGNYDRSYSAEQFAAYFSAFIGNGVYITPATQLQVFAKGDGLAIGIKPGSAFINGYFYANDGTIYKTLTLPDGTNSRIDRIVVRLDLQTRTIALDILEGIASLNPTAKNVTRNGSVYELALADIKVNKSVIQLSDEDITDLRNNSELCGYVHGVVDQIDTTEIFKQFQSAFDNWFANVQYTLDGDAAGKLQNQIDYNKQHIEFGTIDTTQSYSASDSIEGDLIVTEFTKNLFNPTLETTTQNGVTCTKNGDGTYTLNGTATNDAKFSLINQSTATIIQMIDGKSLKVTGFKETGNYRLECTAWLPTGGTYVFDSRIWNVPNGAKGLRIDVVVLSGATLNDVVVKPMLTTDLEATYDDFVPYSGYEIKTCGKNLVGIPDTIANPTINPAKGTITFGAYAVAQAMDSYLRLYSKVDLSNIERFRVVVESVGVTVNSGSTYILIKTGSLSIMSRGSSGANRYVSNVLTSSSFGGTIDEITVVVGKNYLYPGGTYKIAIYDADSDYSDIEPYKGTSIQVSADTQSPVYGLKSFGGCTHIISPANVKAVYPVNKAGADLIQSINSNGEKIEMLDSQVYGSESDNGLVSKVEVLETSKEYVDWLEGRCYPRDSVWFQKTETSMAHFLLDNYNLNSGVYIRAGDNFVVNYHGRLYPFENNATYAQAMQTYIILSTLKQITIPLTSDPSLKLFEIYKSTILGKLLRDDKQLSDIMFWMGGCEGVAANGCGAQVNVKVDTESDSNNIIVYIGTGGDANAVLAKGATIVVSALSFGAYFKS